MAIRVHSSNQYSLVTNHLLNIMKKNLLLFVVAMVATLSVWAQVPQTLTYQAVVRDANGRLICNSNVGVQLSIVQGTEDGTAVYTDRQTVHTNANGLFTMLIGSEENSIGGIDWAAGPYYLKSEIDPTGGSNYTLETVQQLFSVPYALRAHTVDSIIGGVNYNETDPVFTAWDKDYNDLINRPTIPTAVSELANDAGYLTFFTESQILSISNDTIFLTGGSYVKLPAGFSGDYNDLINRPNLADSVSRIVNEYHLGDTIINYISQNGYVDSSYVINYNTQQGYVDTSYVTNYINNGGAITTESDPIFTAWDKDYNDLINLPAIPTAVSELSNDAGYLTSYTEVQSLGDVTTIGNAANSQLKAVSDPTEDLDAVNLRTLNLTINDVVADWTHRFDSITSRFDSITHRYDSIIRGVDSIIAYQDSVIDTLTQQLAILGITTGDTTAVECEMFNWYGTEYTVSGDYQHILTNSYGYDSILTMHLTINHGSHNAENQTACESYTWHGNNYTANGTYTYEYTNGVGCASTDTLHLSTQSTHNSITQSACDRYTWHSTSYSSSGNYTYSYTNSSGCASVDTLHLTIKQSTHNSVTQSAASSYTWHGTTYTASGNYTYSYTNSAGCASVDTLHLIIGGFDANGASSALFSVSATKKVRFSKGNLQFTTTGTHAVSGGSTKTGTWRFAENQYDIIGWGNSLISSTRTEWIDLFALGTSGWQYDPWYSSHFNTSSATASSFRGPYTNKDITGENAKADWGVYNAISNGGNSPGMWRVLTKDQMEYLLNTRNASTVGGTVNGRYARAAVAGRNGIIIFPDSYTHPSGVTAPTNVNSSSSTYASNTYNATQWTKMQNAGAIFLPAAGFRTCSSDDSANNTEIKYYYGTDAVATYWVSGTYTRTFSSVVYTVNWNFYYNFFQGELENAIGRSVRLVMDAN